VLLDAGFGRNEVLAAWNEKAAEDAIGEVLACCGSRAWAAGLVAGRPYGSEADLRASADAVWLSLGEKEWLEAFACHPRIGARIGARAGGEAASGTFEKWSGQEQSLVTNAAERVRLDLARGNEDYAARFGFTYIVCATGKSGEEMLDILSQRLSNDRVSELKEAAEQQRQITQVRLSKWLKT
jgi:2-oxo-4-hydroxy-4-carboxy-5-ureidoimidazoline decarboxylase